MATDNCVCINDIQKLAEMKLNNDALNYYNTGATDEQTLEENCTAFKSWQFQPRVLRNVSNIDTSTYILGNKVPVPICISPTAMNKMASMEGEIASARAAKSIETIFTLSTWATTSIEDLACNVPGAFRWLQITLFKDKEEMRNLVRRATETGYRAIVVTVDMPVGGKRYRQQRSKFNIPPNLALENFAHLNKNNKDSPYKTGVSKYLRAMFDSAATWEDIDWLKTITDLPIVVKGILTADMALEALEHKVAAIYISNHGARQLDGVLPTINALPQIVKAVAGRCEIYLDGGIRNGGDVAKAIALGATAVFIGRPIIWGLACDGEKGASMVLRILQEEFELTMKLLGITSIADLQSVSDIVIHESKILSRL